MADPIVEELNERFAPGGKPLEVDVMGELQSIMRLHLLSPQDLFFKWESYCIKMDMDEMRPKYDTIRGFKQDLQDALERNNRSQAAHVKTEKRMGATPRAGGKGAGGDVFGMLDGLVPSTPGTSKLNKSGSARRKNMETPSMSRVKSEHPASSPSTLERQLDSLGALTPSSFNDRANPGEIIEVLNNQLPAAEPPIAPFSESRIKLTAASDLKKLGYRPMAMKLSEASEILDDRIEEFTNFVMQHHNLDESAFGSAANQSTSEIICVGRIASDTSEGRLNAASLVLETSRRSGGGLRAPLNLQKLPGYQFFPGQIVALRGTNASGHEFNVSEVLQIPLLPNAASTPEALEAHRQRLQGGPDAMDSDSDPMPLNVMFASGPYSADDNLDFEPLHTICNQAADTYADALVLTGPFIDIDHPLIAAGDFDLPEDANIDPDQATMATLFKYMISPALNQLAASNPQVTILLIPSVRDAIDKHVSWPQDAFPRKDLGLPKAAKIVGNPMTFSINETLVGISSQDVLYQLQGGVLAGGKAPDGMDRLSRLARNVIEQRHYFPLFPPMDRSKLPKTGTAEELALGSVLDVSYLKLGEMVNVRPDVLVLPSAMPPFARVVESVLIINPGYLSKRRGPGTYARMTLYPPKVPQEGTPHGVVGHSVYERARVEITRI
ncbi:hypothetical protein PoMZ_11421 [Pyricularia oryzae]|uniref:DNA polymerase alpha subunit B n=1 Tax=Pyricularia oryzae TaxID=318829 RepID=A0A4P7NKG4_PYROR|nr:hypothetical protein PoMZ_11421 [Pyricularia oryzae]